MILGINYNNVISCWTKLGFIPKWTEVNKEENLNYLTYNIISSIRNATCNTYPICDFTDYITKLNF